MNEELEKEADKWLVDNLHSTEEDYKRAYLALAEPREKQIAELSKHIVELQNDKGELIDRCRELEAQIEKMKNWCNCKNYQQCLIELAEQGKGMKPSECCVNCKKWEIKEND